jgi:hypothetical protein
MGGMTLPHSPLPLPLLPLRLKKTMGRCQQQERLRPRQWRRDISNCGAVFVGTAVHVAHENETTPVNTN